MNIFINVIIATVATIIIMTFDSLYFKDIAKYFNIETAYGIRVFGFLSIIMGSPIAVLFNLDYKLVFFEFAGFVITYILITEFYYVVYCYPEEQN